MIRELAKTKRRIADGCEELDNIPERSIDLLRYSFLKQKSAEIDFIEILLTTPPISSSIKHGILPGSSSSGFASVPLAPMEPQLEEHFMVLGLWDAVAAGRCHSKPLRNPPYVGSHQGADG